jgi:hypothetical protein
VRFDFQIRNECAQHFLVLPIHLDVIQFSVDSNWVEEGLKCYFVEDECVAAEATWWLIYSTHSRWLKFLEMICRQVFPISLNERSTLEMRFIPSKTSIYSAHSSPIPFFLRLTIFKHLISTILLRNSLRVFFENPYFDWDLLCLWSEKGQLSRSYEIY